MNKGVTKVYRIVFVGAPSTGKTTLVKMCAEHYDTVWMHEFGRDYWMEHQVDRRLTPEQLVEIAKEHTRLEDEMLPRANRYLFSDTNAITTYMFAIDYHGKAHPELAELAREAELRYDLVFLCDIDIPYEDTWERSGKVYRERFQRDIIEDLDHRGIPFVLLSGTIEQRFNRTVSEIENLKAESM